MNLAMTLGMLVSKFVNVRFCIFTTSKFLLTSSARLTVRDGDCCGPWPAVIVVFMLCNVESVECFLL